jgi:hypothetical protein
MGDVLERFNPTQNSLRFGKGGTKMSMSTCVYGLKPPDERWKKMKAIYDSCEAANVDIPTEVNDFFEHEIPDDKGVKVYISDSHDCCSNYSNDGEDGYEIDVLLLPKDIKIIRFVNSW